MISAGERTIRSANALTGPRIYSTDFHPSYFRAGPLSEDASRALIRSLKIKLITRGTVTINGAHLIHPGAAHLLAQNEALLTHDLLLPAMRMDRQSFSEYAEDHVDDYRRLGWSDTQIASAARFVDDRVQQILPWRVEQANEAFRNEFLRGIAAPASAIRRLLHEDANTSDDLMAAFLKRLDETDFAEERAVAAAIEHAPQSWHEPLQRYAFACYHFVGTSVVNCETGLDRHSLLAIRMQDFIARDSLLSESSVFMRLFLDAAMEAINSPALPINIIDSLPINDLRRVRDALLVQDFQAKYDQLIQEFFATAESPGEKTLSSFDADRVVSLAQDLSNYFRSYFQTELPTYRTRSELESATAIAQQSFSTVKSALGMAPGIGQVVSMLDLLSGGVQLAKGAIDWVTARSDRAIALSDARTAREREMGEILERLGSSRKAVLLSAVRELHSIAALANKPP